MKYFRKTNTYANVTLKDALDANFTLMVKKVQPTPAPAPSAHQRQNGNLCLGGKIRKQNPNGFQLI